MILVIDNYDSFVYNLAQYLGELGWEPVVYRNDQINLDEIEALRPSHIVISPGPGTRSMPASPTMWCAASGGGSPSWGCASGISASDMPMAASS